MKVKVKKTRGTTGNQHNYGLVSGSIWNYEDKPTTNNVSVTLSAVPRDEANIEAERNETIVFPDQDGTVSHAKIGGKRHYQGGTPLNVPDGSFVFSDYNKMKIKNKDVLRDIFNMNAKKGATPAEIAKKYEIETYKKTLKDPWADPMDKKTAQLMLENNMKKLGQLALIQESMKGFPDGIPAIAQPLFGSDIAQGQPSPQDQMPAELAEAKHGGLLMAQSGKSIHNSNIKNQINQAIQLYKTSSSKEERLRTYNWLTNILGANPEYKTIPVVKSFLAGLSSRAQDAYGETIRQKSLAETNRVNTEKDAAKWEKYKKDALAKKAAEEKAAAEEKKKVEKAKKSGMYSETGWGQPVEHAYPGGSDDEQTPYVKKAYILYDEALRLAANRPDQLDIYANMIKNIDVPHSMTMPGTSLYNFGSGILNAFTPFTFPDIAPTGRTWQEKVNDMGDQLMNRAHDLRFNKKVKKEEKKRSPETISDYNKKLEAIREAAINVVNNPSSHTTDQIDAATTILNWYKTLNTNPIAPQAPPGEYIDRRIGYGILDGTYKGQTLNDLSKVINGPAIESKTKSEEKASTPSPSTSTGSTFSNSNPGDSVIAPINTPVEKTSDDYGDENTMSNNGTTTTQGSSSQGNGQTQTVKVKKDKPAAPAIDYDNLSITQMRQILSKNGYQVPPADTAVENLYNSASQFTPLRKKGGELKKYQTGDEVVYKFIPDTDKSEIEKTYTINYNPYSMAAVNPNIKGAGHQVNDYIATPGGSWIHKSRAKDAATIDQQVSEWDKNHPAYDFTTYDGGFDQYAKDKAAISKLKTSKKLSWKQARDQYEKQTKRNPYKFKADNYTNYYRKYAGADKNYFNVNKDGSYTDDALVEGAQFITTPKFDEIKKAEEKKIIEEEKKVVEKEKTKQEEVPGTSYESGISPAPWWNYDVVNYGNQLGNYFGIEQGQLPPYMQYNPYLADPTFVDPARAIAQQQGLARQSQDAIMSAADPTTGRANVIAAQAQAAPQVANIMSQYDNQNVGIANQFEQQNAQTMNQAQLQNQKFQQLYADEIATRRQQYLNALREGKTNVAKSIMQGMKNAAETSWENATSDSYAVDPTSGQVYFKRGFDSTTGSFRSSNSLSFTDWKKANGLDSYVGDESALIKAYTEYLRSNKYNRSRRRTDDDDDDKKMGGKVKKAKYLHGGIVFNPIDHIWNI
jgi:hypothetical protein